MSNEQRLTNLGEFAEWLARWELRWQERSRELAAAQALSDAKLAELGEAQLKTQAAMAALDKQ
jgi:hypothetical protein